MTVAEFAQIILDRLPYQPTTQQVELIAALAHFCSRQAPAESVFLLNGYAGTGKTSLCAALVKALDAVGIGTVLLAPTGRAAKVFASFAGHPAYTIHRRIYAGTGGPLGPAGQGRLVENRGSNLVFIVDEASMIGGESMGGNLLEDLIHYVYAGPGCRLILIGDGAQLPPVGCDESPAMSATVLHSMGLRVTRATLTATVRQASHSGILYNATRLRRMMRIDPLPLPSLVVSRFPDVATISSEEVEDRLNSSYAANGILSTILITRSNRMATDFNRAVRYSILGMEEEVMRDDVVLISKNNYYWSRQVKGLDFLANGDMAVVEQVYGTELRYGMRFADVRLSLTDRDVEVDCKIMLDSLLSDDASISRGEMAELFQAIMADPDTEGEVESERMANASKSPYFNALQVKYGYAVTCHKAQGGQWHDVYVDMSYIPNDALGITFYRWLYTAMTRATHRLWFINPTIEVK